jgi:hypothetical protein
MVPSFTPLSHYDDLHGNVCSIRLIVPQFLVKMHSINHPFILDAENLTGRRYLTLVFFLIIGNSMSLKLTKKTSEQAMRLQSCNGYTFDDNGPPNGTMILKVYLSVLGFSIKMVVYLKRRFRFLD